MREGEEKRRGWGVYFLFLSSTVDAELMSHDAEPGIAPSHRHRLLAHKSEVSAAVIAIKIVALLLPTFIFLLKKIFVLEKPND